MTSQNLDWDQHKICLDKTQIYRLIEKLRHPMFFDSGSSPDKGRYAILSGDPIWHSIDNTSILDDTLIAKSDLSQVIPSIYRELPFVCGFLGFLSYDYGERMQRISGEPSLLGPETKDHLATKQANEASVNSRARLEDIDYPLNTSGYYAWSYIFDKKHQQGFVTFSPACPTSLRAKILREIEKPAADTKPVQTEVVDSKGNLSDISWRADQTFKQYQTSYDKIIDYIKAGDCYQVNLTQRFSAASKSKSLDIYFDLRNLVNTHFAGYFELSQNHQIICYSPEQFIAIKDRKITTRPIKGTIENKQDLDTSLADSNKDKAENLMIVDLLRNDLSKVSKPFTVKVPELFTLETYTNVHHLVSQIEGELKDDITELEAFMTCFPGGSITGAPKIRAMEIINELEPHNRGPYCGSIFFWNDNGNFDSNILIRTIAKTKERLHVWGGGGITIGSDLESEYKESITKVENLMKGSLSVSS